MLSLVTVAIDRRNENGLLSQSIVGNATDAQSILTTIATAVVTLTSIVLTVTLVAVQLAMGQFSPRIVRALLDDRGDQIAIAVFGATFTFSVFSLRAIDTGPGGEAVPGVTVLTALALAVASSLALLVFVHHASQQLRVGTLVDLVGNELRAQLERRFPTEPEVRENASVLVSRRAGNLIHCERDALVAEARRAGCTLELVPMMGDFVTRGAPLVRVHGDGARLDRERVRQLIALDNERTHSDDPAYGFRKLVDVAQRALGTSSNDATTAVQVVNRLHDCLHQIADRPFPNGHVRDEDDELRLIERVLDWDGYVRLAFDEIRLAAGGYPQVTRRLEAALTDLKTVAPAERQPALDRQLRLLAGCVARALDEEDDRRAALSPTSRASARARTSWSASRRTKITRTPTAEPRIENRGLGQRSGVSPEVVMLDLAGTDEFSLAHESLPRTDRKRQRTFSPNNELGGNLKLLLTSAGIKNASIHGELVDLLAKPITESSALCIPTAMYGHPWVGPGEKAWQFISGQEPSCPMCELGWKSLGVLELTALPSIDEERWVPLVQETDVLLASGGDALYLCHWMRESGLADVLPSLDETVWVGLSAGSMVMTPRIGEDFVGWKPPTGGDETLGIVDFSIFPHLDNEDLPSNTMANAERWVAGLSTPAYAIDDETAIRVTDGTVDVISEGHWKLLTSQD